MGYLVREDCKNYSEVSRRGTIDTAVNLLVFNLMLITAHEEKPSSPGVDSWQCRSVLLGLFSAVKPDSLKMAE